MITPTAEGMQAIKIIPESDVYRLIMRSRLGREFIINLVNKKAS